MDEIGKYHAKWNKPSPKNQRLNVFSDKWMMIYNKVGWREEEKNKGTLEGIEENGVGRGGNGKIIDWNRQYYPRYMYDYMNGVNLLCVQT